MDAMIWRIITVILVTKVSSNAGVPSNIKCLTGNFTDVQSWIDDNGKFLEKVESTVSVDVSHSTKPVEKLRRRLDDLKKSRVAIKYLNMASCNLRKIPKIFNLRTPDGSILSDSLQYVSFYGNNFEEYNKPSGLFHVHLNAANATEVTYRPDYARLMESTWPLGFKGTVFWNLKELDLRSCSIQTISHNPFEGMPALENLYLSYNQIFFLNENTFYGLKNLVHLDMSHNELTTETGVVKLNFESPEVFDPLKNLQSLDFSYTKLNKNIGRNFKVLGPDFVRLSICNTGLKNLSSHVFENTSLRILDVSGNYDLLAHGNFLNGIADTLEVMAADSSGVKSMNVFKGLKELTFLSLKSNEISVIEPTVTESLTKLKVLLIPNNRLQTWTKKTFSHMKNLEFLSMENNNINIIKPEMIEDLMNVKYAGLSENFFVCNCYAKVLYQIASRNADARQNETLNFIESEQVSVTNKVSKFHIGVDILKDMIRNHNRNKKKTDNNSDFYTNSKLTLYDLSEKNYQCLSLEEGINVPFAKVKHCNNRKEIPYDDILQKNMKRLLFLIVLPSLIILIVGVVYYFKRNFVYFCISVKNAAMLSLMSDKTGSKLSEDTIFNYDVFVSYCNEDRAWVLDHLLLQVENQGSVSVCLHERDFQVGLSILENIVCCMDRSRTIMLIISHKFLRSQWCQFEMHLAQHRLLETRREDLILVLLEDIPRRMRPNTLHYLMLTKTYLQWPKDPTEQPAFWKRLKKSLILQKIKQSENVSLA